MAFQVHDEMHANRRQDQDSLQVQGNFNDISMVISGFHGKIPGQPSAAFVAWLTSESELLLVTRSNDNHSHNKHNILLMIVYIFSCNLSFFKVHILLYRSFIPRSHHDAYILILASWSDSKLYIVLLPLQ